jgi:predicted alpha/beta superfamily hydrolase
VAHVQPSEIFGAGLVVSPFVWWDEQWILRQAESSPLRDGARPKVWLDIGGLEGAEAIPAARQLRDALLKRGWDANTLSYVEQADGGHDEATWALRVPGMLKFLYGKERLLK